MNSSSCSTSSGRNSDSDENNPENYPRLSDNSQKISCLKILLGRAQSACVQNESVENILSHLNEMRSYLNELRVNILIEERNTNNASQVLSVNSSQITHINQTDVAGSEDICVFRNSYSLRILRRVWLCSARTETS
jgi:hypothetical protein